MVQNIQQFPRQRRPPYWPLHKTTPPVTMVIKGTYLAINPSKRFYTCKLDHQTKCTAFGQHYHIKTLMACTCDVKWTDFCTVNVVSDQVTGPLLTFCSTYVTRHTELICAPPLPTPRSSCISVFISSRTKGQVSRWPLRLLWRAEEYFGGPKNRYLAVFLLHHIIVNVVRNTANPLVSWTADDRCPNTRKKWYTFILDIKKGLNAAMQ